jgi:hypothetical protein
MFAWKVSNMVVGSLLHGGDEVALEAVEPLDHQLHARFLGVVGGLAVDLGGALPLVVAHGVSGENTERLVIGAHQDLGPGGMAGIDDALQVIHRGGAVRGLGAARAVGFVGNHGHRGRAQALVAQGITDFLVERDIGRENRQLDAIVACSFEGREEVKLIFLELAGPEEQVEADVHGGFLSKGRNATRRSIFRANVILLPFL